MTEDSRDSLEHHDSYDVVPLPEPTKPPTIAATKIASAPSSVVANDASKADDSEDIEDIEHNRPLAVLSYVGPFVVIPLVFARESKFARFHANQGLILFLLEFALWACNWVLGFFFMPVVLTTSSGFFDAVAHLYGLAAGALWTILAVLSFVGILHAIAGANDKLPVIGNFSIVKI